MALSQVADLRDFADGVPRNGAVRACGRRWHNRTVAPFLACGVAGALGAGAPEEAPGTQPRARPAALPDTVSWAEFTEFLVCGQAHE